MVEEMEIYQENTHIHTPLQKTNKNKTENKQTKTINKQNKCAQLAKTKTHRFEQKKNTLKQQQKQNPRIMTLVIGNHT